MTNDIISENTFGARNQLEVDVPIDFNRSAPGLWHGGVGDATIGLKRVMFANLHTGSILSGFGGVILPSGNRSHGLGNGRYAVRNFRRVCAIAPERKLRATASGNRPADRYVKGAAVALLAIGIR